VISLSKNKNIMLYLWNALCSVGLGYVLLSLPRGISRHKIEMWYWKILHAMNPLLLSPVFEKNNKNIPITKPPRNVLLISNHQGYLDIFYILYYLRENLPEHRPVFFFATSSLKTTPRFFREHVASTHVAIDLDAENNGEAAEAKVQALLGSGHKHVVVIFPEGRVLTDPKGRKMDQLHHVLEPRASGVYRMLSRVDAVLDMTLFYPEVALGCASHSDPMRLLVRDGYSSRGCVRVEDITDRLQKKTGVMMTYDDVKTILHNVWIQKNEWIDHKASVVKWVVEEKLVEGVATAIGWIPLHQVNFFSSQMLGFAILFFLQEYSTPYVLMAVALYTTSWNFHLYRKHETLDRAAAVVIWSWSWLQCRSLLGRRLLQAMPVFHGLGHLFNSWYGRPTWAATTLHLLLHFCGYGHVLCR